MFTGADYYIRHPQDEEQTTTIAFDEMPDDKLNAAINKAALSNQDREIDAITKADSYSFQVANPQFKRTAQNTRVMNHQLTSWGINNPTYEDFARAYDALKDSGLLEIDEVKEAPRTFTGTFSKKTFDNVDDLVINERHAARTAVTPLSPEDIALETLPTEELTNLLKGRDHADQRRVDFSKSQRAGDAWITQHKEYKDTKVNALLMRQQLATNGVLESSATVADYETAYNQLRDSGLLALNQTEINKQHQETLRQEATEALHESVEPSEDEMYAMPMAELEKRARGW